MFAIENCKRCGGSSFGEGVIGGQGQVFPKKRTLFSLGGSTMDVVICLDCGEVNSMRVTSPDKFKQK